MRILLITSVVLNSVLIMTVTGIMPFLLFMSLLLNTGAAWLIFRLLRQANEVNQDLEEMLETVFNLEDHLRSLYQMETFYGDQTLQSLIDHTKDVVNDIEFYRQKYSFDDEVRVVEGEEPSFEEGQ